jgi:hypothetical protein
MLQRMAKLVGQLSVRDKHESDHIPIAPVAPSSEALDPAASAKR